MEKNKEDSEMNYTEVKIGKKPIMNYATAILKAKDEADFVYIKAASARNIQRLISALSIVKKKKAIKILDSKFMFIYINKHEVPSLIILVKKLSN